MLIYVAINAVLLEAYLDTDGSVGGETLFLFNIPVLALAVLVYIIAKIPLDK
jgi:hypothetical protein